MNKFIYALLAVSMLVNNNPASALTPPADAQQIIFEYKGQLPQKKEGCTDGKDFSVYVKKVDGNLVFLTEHGEEIFRKIAGQWNSNVPNIYRNDEHIEGTGNNRTGYTFAMGTVESPKDIIKNMEFAILRERFIQLGKVICDWKWESKIEDGNP
jgi:hypothetical protein